jgi:bis(5'-nucleosyl)-tetraphosphatase (symmetrical)
VIVNVCTRLRFCSADDVLELAEKRGPGHAPPGYAPWFAHPHRRSASVTVFCGHWSTLHLTLAPRVVMLDSGCLWGGTLSALRIDDRRVFQIPSRAPLDPMPKD